MDVSAKKAAVRVINLTQISEPKMLEKKGESSESIIPVNI
jgi:hypothetical protein